MKRLLLSLSLILVFACSLMAQVERYEVTIHMKDGSTEGGMIEMNMDRPWEYQKSISVFDPALVDQQRIKKKEKTKYKAKDIAGFEADGKYYESKKVMIAGRGDYGSTLKALPSYALIQRLIDGPITVYKAFAYPPAVASGVSFQDIYYDLLSNPEYFMVKGSGKIKTMHNANIQKWIADAPETSEKFADGGFGNMKRKKKKKLANFLKDQIENENPNIILDVVRAYNEEKGE